MKGCKNYEKMFVAGLYDELTADERNSLNTHLQNCKDCASTYQQLSGTLTTMDQRLQPEMEEGYWDSFWRNLKDKITEETPEQKPLKWLNQFLSSLRSKWVLVPVAAGLVLVFGIYLGSTFFSPSSQTPTPVMADNTQAASETNMQSVLSKHLEDMRPMLVECSNISSQQSIEESGDAVTIDRATLKKLVVQNYLLKKMVAQSKDPALKKMLNELELILVLMSNRNGDAQQDLLNIKDIIKNQDLLFKTKIYSQKPLSRKI